MIHVFLQDNTCISTRWYMYFSKMIHVFLQDDTWICHNCVHYFCWELSALSRDWAGCPSHLLSESRRCRGYVAVFFHCTFVSTLLCNIANMHNPARCLATSFTFLHTLQQIAINKSLIVLSNLFSRNEDWKKSNRVQFTMHPAPLVPLVPCTWRMVYCVANAE